MSEAISATRARYYELFTCPGGAESSEWINESSEYECGETVEIEINGRNVSNANNKC